MGGSPLWVAIDCMGKEVFFQSSCLHNICNGGIILAGHILSWFESLSRADSKSIALVVTDNSYASSRWRIEVLRVQVWLNFRANECIFAREIICMTTL